MLKRRSGRTQHLYAGQLSHWGAFEMDSGNDVAKPVNVLSIKSFSTRKDAAGNQAVGAEARMLDVSFAGYARKSRKNFVGPDRTKGVPPLDQLDLYNFPVPSERLLRACFNLTPAEIRLAQIISRGEPLRHAADLLGIRMPTARSQLASVFLKTKIASAAAACGFVEPSRPSQSMAYELTLVEAALSSSPAMHVFLWLPDPSETPGRRQETSG